MLRHLAAATLLLGCGARTHLGEGHGADVESVDASWTVCGDASCDPSVEYCKQVFGGPPPGVHLTNCIALASGCHSCDCVIQPVCTCEDDTGHITLTCDVP